MLKRAQGILPVHRRGRGPTGALTAVRNLILNPVPTIHTNQGHRAMDQKLDSTQRQNPHLTHGRRQCTRNPAPLPTDVQVFNCHLIHQYTPYTLLARVRLMTPTPIRRHISDLPVIQGRHLPTTPILPNTIHPLHCQTAIPNSYGYPQDVPQALVWNQFYSSFLAKGLGHVEAVAKTRQKWARDSVRSLLPGAPLQKGKYHSCCTRLGNGKTFVVSCDSEERGQALEHELFHNES